MEKSILRQEFMTYREYLIMTQWAINPTAKIVRIGGICYNNDNYNDTQVLVEYDPNQTQARLIEFTDQV